MEAPAASAMRAMHAADATDAAASDATDATDGAGPDVGRKRSRIHLWTGISWMFPPTFVASRPGECSAAPSRRARPADCTGTGNVDVTGNVDREYVSVELSHAVYPNPFDAVDAPVETSPTPSEITADQLLGGVGSDADATTEADADDDDADDGTSDRSSSTYSSDSECDDEDEDSPLSVESDSEDDEDADVEQDDEDADDEQDDEDDEDDGMDDDDDDDDEDDDEDEDDEDDDEDEPPPLESGSGSYGSDASCSDHFLAELHSLTELEMAHQLSAMRSTLGRMDHAISALTTAAYLMLGALGWSLIILAGVNRPQT
jgi:hypothetical protein